MRLTKVERLILANQLKILEKLFPDDADSYANARAAIEQGFQLQYAGLFETIYEEMSEADCKKVLEILDLHRALKFSFDRLKDKQDITERQIRFHGFDGNNEPKQYAYANYFIGQLGRFNELAGDRKFLNFNSHTPTLPRYQKMLDNWMEYKSSFELSAEQIKAIIQIV